MNNTQSTVQQAVSHEHMVAGYYRNIIKAKNNLRLLKKTYKEAIENDADYARIQLDIDDLKRKQAMVKSSIESYESMQKMKYEIKDMIQEIKDMQLGLFAHLDAYVKHSGQKQIEIDGDIKEIVTNYSLKTTS